MRGQLLLQGEEMDAAEAIGPVLRLRSADLCSGRTTLECERGRVSFASISLIRCIVRCSPSATSELARSDASRWLRSHPPAVTVVTASDDRLVRSGRAGLPRRSLSCSPHRPVAFASVGLWPSYPSSPDPFDQGVAQLQPRRTRGVTPSHHALCTCNTGQHRRVRDDD